MIRPRLNDEPRRLQARTAQAASTVPSAACVGGLRPTTRGRRTLPRSRTRCGRSRARLNFRRVGAVRPLLAALLGTLGTDVAGRPGGDRPMRSFQIPSPRPESGHLATGLARPKCAISGRLRGQRRRAVPSPGRARVTPSPAALAGRGDPKRQGRLWSSQIARSGPHASTRFLRSVCRLRRPRRHTGSGHSVSSRLHNV